MKPVNESEFAKAMQPIIGRVDTEPNIAKNIVEKLK